MADLREMMIQNKLSELEELEKGIVLASLQIDKMVGMGPAADLSTMAGIRRRRETIEKEYILAKRELTELRAGVIPDEAPAVKRQKIAQQNLRKFKEAKEKLKGKRENAEGELYEPDEDDEKLIFKDIKETGGHSLDT
jgi:hypothetical protein